MEEMVAKANKTIGLIKRVYHEGTSLIQPLESHFTALWLDHDWNTVATCGPHIL